jgi:hypothetical protein
MCAMGHGYFPRKQLHETFFYGHTLAQLEQLVLMVDRIVFHTFCTTVVIDIEVCQNLQLARIRG